MFGFRFKLPVAHWQAARARACANLKLEAPLAGCQ